MKAQQRKTYTAAMFTAMLSKPSVSALLLLLISGLMYAATPASARTCRLTSCERKEKVENFGFNAVKEVVQIDIGACEPVYETSEGCAIPTVNQVTQQEGSGEHEPCPRKCEPRSYSMILSSNRDSPISVRSIKSCYGTRHHCIKRCIRKPSYVYMFPGSKYQQRIDVGKCVGQCVDTNATLDCAAVQHRGIAVEGPNGYETVQVIQECSCQNTLCYRADHFQSFSEIVVDQSNNTTTQKRRRDKLINIGKCIGSCPGVEIPGTCYPSDDWCQLKLPPRPAHCVPTVGMKHTYLDLDEKVQSVAAIVECGCSTG